MRQADLDFAVMTAIPMKQQVSLALPAGREKVGAQGGAATGRVDVLGKAALCPERNPQPTRQAQLCQALAGVGQQTFSGGGSCKDGGLKRAGVDWDRDGGWGRMGFRRHR